jgi:hypothetical protein
VNWDALFAGMAVVFGACTLAVLAPAMDGARLSGKQVLLAVLFGTVTAVFFGLAVPA